MQTLQPPPTRVVVPEAIQGIILMETMREATADRWRGG
jgi:hypothetical protein